MAGVRFEGVWKLFESAAAVADLSLEVTEGEFLVFVGPSGCGKTTSLRMLAGLERPTYGRIWIGDRVVNNVPPGDRDISMVFQSYALYPHMTVYKNLAFGPRIRRESKQETKKRVGEVAQTLGIAELLDRRPSELSGGQRQRVALGRALIREPQLFLMDEPLSNLDAALRVQMRTELIRLHKQFSITTVYVTHDQIEAMTMGDRICVMQGGCLQQADRPHLLYECPNNLFVATFIGSPKMNLCEGELISDEGPTAVRCLGTTIRLAHETPIVGERCGGRRVIVGIRPSDLHWSEDGVLGCSVRLTAQVDIVEPMGSETYVTAKVDDTSLVSRFPARSHVRTDEVLDLVIDPKHLYLFDAQSGVAIIDRRPLVLASNQSFRQQQIPAHQPLA